MRGTGPIIGAGGHATPAHEQIPVLCDNVHAASNQYLAASTFAAKPHGSGNQLALELASGIFYQFVTHWLYQKPVTQALLHKANFA